MKKKGVRLLGMACGVTGAGWEGTYAQIHPGKRAEKNKMCSFAAREKDVGTTAKKRVVCTPALATYTLYAESLTGNSGKTRKLTAEYTNRQQLLLRWLFFFNERCQ